ncbi:MAG: hypothetical protein Q8N18_08570 [Opitutaceae bacterium]|nr:hypothetical protein [Opitutaceae bacterium]
MPTASTLRSFVLLRSALPLAAQSAAPAAGASDATVQLSPFEVRTDKDTGYTATNTLAGSRLNPRRWSITSTVTF